MRGHPPCVSGIGLGTSVAALVAPAVAIAHGPPDWLMAPTAVWGAFALFALFAGTGAFASRALSDRTRRRGGWFAFCVVSVVSACGLILAVVLAAQGPWSRPFAIMVALLAAFLALLAVLTRPGGGTP